MKLRSARGMTKELVSKAVKYIVGKYLGLGLDIAEVKAVKKAERELLATQNTDKFQAAINAVKPASPAENQQEISTLKILFAIDTKLSKSPVVSVRDYSKLTRALHSTDKGKFSLATDDLSRLSDIVRQRKTYKKYKTFDHTQEIKAEASFSHPAFVVQKPVKKGVEREDKWIYKIIPEGEQKARREVLAQEFLRFLMPWYPKTRLHKTDAKVGVLSKFVEHDHQHLPHSIKSKPQEFGQTCILAPAVGEVDFKIANLRIDKFSRVVKTDGGMCFSNIAEPHRFKFTEEDIAASPFLANLLPDNHLDLVKFQSDGIHQKATSQYFDTSYSNDEEYRHGVNYGILKLLILTNDLIREFVAQYIDDPAEQDLLSQTLIDTREMYQSAALKNANFVNYLQSREARVDHTQFLVDMQGFVTMGKDVFWHHLAQEEQEQVENRFDQLVSEASKPEPDSAKFSRSSSVNSMNSFFSVDHISPPKLGTSVSDSESDTDNVLRNRLKKTLDCELSSPSVYSPA